MMHIRRATGLDRDDVSDVHVTAFPEGEGEVVSRIAICFLSDRTTTQTISLVYEADGIVVGRVAFSPVTMDNDDNLIGYIPAPSGVKAGFQSRSTGS